MTSVSPCSSFPSRARAPWRVGEQSPEKIPAPALGSRDPSIPTLPWRVDDAGNTIQFLEPNRVVSQPEDSSEGIAQFLDDLGAAPPARRLRSQAVGPDDLSLGHNSDQGTRAQMEVLQRVVVTEYPEIGHAVISKQFSPKPQRERPAGTRNRLKNATRATQRAVGRMRRYIERNKLTKRATLTYPNGHGRHDHGKVVGDVARCTAILRKRYGPFPYLYAPEPHPKRGGLHVNLLVPDHIPDIALRVAWAAAIGAPVLGLQVDVRHDGLRLLCNRAAAQASYLSKSAEGFFARRLATEGAALWKGVVVGTKAHFYEVAQGFLPKVVKRVYASFKTALASCSRSLGLGLYVVATSVGRACPGPPFMTVTRR